ncbi:hypothetical protein BKA80DRAFT_114097 [Phyllosticta citrichinensis]
MGKHAGRIVPEFHFDRSINTASSRCVPCAQGDGSGQHQSVRTAKCFLPSVGVGQDFNHRLFRRRVWLQGSQSVPGRFSAFQSMPQNQSGEYNCRCQATASRSLVRLPPSHTSRAASVGFCCCIPALTRLDRCLFGNEKTTLDNRLSIWAGKLAAPHASRL